jgi:hypothetical protein
MSYHAIQIAAAQPSDASLLFATGQPRRKRRSRFLKSAARKIQKAFKDEYELFAKVDTPHGSLLKDMDTGVEAKPGRNLFIKYVCPLALLWLLCNKSDRWLELVQKHAIVKPEQQWVSPVGGPEAEPGGRLILYMDGVVPGNVHRPDPGRAYTSVYWQFLDMPHWILRNSMFWLDLCCVPKRLLRKLPGGESQLATLALRMFKGAGDLNYFEMPMEITERLRIRFDFACFLNDADEHYNVCMAKGAQGTKPCPCCMNVVGRVQPAEVLPGSGLVHFTSTDCQRMIPYSSEDLRALIAFLGEQIATGLSSTEVRKLTQLAGFSYSPYHLLMSDMALHADLPESIYWDWMHTILSSSGVAQYELNQLLRRIRRLNPGEDIYSSIETFLKQHVVFPKAQRMSTLLNLDLKERVKDKNGKHIRAFASEMILLVVGIGMWCCIFLTPNNLLQVEVRCFELLGRIVYILRMGPQAVKKALLLQRLIVEHQKLFLRLYPLEAKPKLHYLLHIPGCLHRFGVNLSCFATERRHKIGKGIAAFSFKNFQLTILRRSLRQMFRTVTDRTDLRPNNLLGTAKPVPDADLELLRALGLWTEEETEETLVSMKASLVHVGEINRGDLFVAKHGSHFEIGMASRFFTLSPKDFDGEVTVECEVLRHEGGITYRLPPAQEGLTYVHGSLVVGLVPYLSWEAHVFHIVASADMLAWEE